RVGRAAHVLSCVVGRALLGAIARDVDAARALPRRADAREPSVEPAAALALSEIADGAPAMERRERVGQRVDLRVARCVDRRIRASIGGTRNAVVDAEDLGTPG